MTIKRFPKPMRHPAGEKAGAAFRTYLRRMGDSFGIRNGGAYEEEIITVVGKDIVGIIAKICTYLAENGINILDISQTIVQGYFNMMMIVDTSTLAKPFGDMADELTALGEEIGVVIRCQKEEIFDKMHRI